MSAWETVLVVVVGLSISLVGETLIRGTFDGGTVASAVLLAAGGTLLSDDA